jgi:1-deoxy-D-xylulose-5-phosphate reductoisomerase
MVEYEDGSILAQLGQPDMRTPIAHAMAWPQRMDAGVESLNLFDVAQLDFEQPDYQRFPCLRLAEQAARQGGTSPAVLNAANEVAVQAFLDNDLAFTAIPYIVETVLTGIDSQDASSLEIVLQADQQARQHANQLIYQSNARVE